MEQRVRKFERVAVQPQVALALGGREIPGKSGWVAHVEMANGDVVVADKLDAETAWRINGLFRANGLPVFFNGNLSRCTAAVLVDDDVAELLNEELHFAEWQSEQDEAERS